MKKIFFKQPIVAVLLVILIFPGCLKDRVTHTYTLTEPIYKALSAVRADMKTGPAIALDDVGKIYVQGNYIFINEVEKGIHIIDNTNPSKPINMSFINIPGNEDIAVKGTTLYADSYNDLVAFDISDPLHAAPKKFLTNIFPDRGNYYPNTNPDSILIIVGWIKKDTTVNYDESSPQLYFNGGCASCVFVNAVPAASTNNKGTGGSMARFTIVNDYLYTVNNQNLNVLDITIHDDPVFKTQSPLSWTIETIYPFKNRLFIGTNSGIYMYDISSTPGNPTSIGEFSHARSCDPVIADDDYAYVTLSDGTKCQGFQNQLDIIDVKNIDGGAFLVKSYPLVHPKGLSKDGNTLFICDDKDGLKVFDATDVKNLKLISHLTESEPHDVITNNGLALVVAKNGLFQYDYSDISNIHLISQLSTGKD